MANKEISPIALYEGGTGSQLNTVGQMLLNDGVTVISAGSGATGTFFAGGNLWSPSLGQHCIVTNISSGSGTHTINANAKFIEVICVGGGGSGGSGRSGTSAASGGGSGGSGGGVNQTRCPVAFFGGAGASISYSVGAGGTHALGVSNANGNAGNPGGATTFGNIYALGGLAGNAGTTSGGAGVYAPASYWGPVVQCEIGQGPESGAGSLTAGTSAPTLSYFYGNYSPSSGGGGAGGNSSTSYAGGAGGAFLNAAATQVLAGGKGGSATIVAGGGGGQGTTSGFHVSFSGGTGGGGGAYHSSGTSGTGGPGGFPGGGGGGGAGSVSPIASATSGAGGAGIIVIAEWI